ncbi:MAG: hypothetical protein AAF740_10570, partial [Bacteroidota bacterium]
MALPSHNSFAADPTLEDFTVFTPINTTYTFTQADFENAYTDTDGDAITEVQILNIPVASRGEVQYNGAAIAFASLPFDVSIADINAGLLTFVPANGFEGSANIRWDANNAVDSYPNDPDYVIIRIGDYLNGCTVDNPPRVKDIEMVKKRDFTGTGTDPYITPFVGDFNGDGETDVFSGGTNNFRILDPKETTTAAATIVNYTLPTARRNGSRSSALTIADVFTYDDATNTITSNTPDGKAEIFYYSAANTNIVTDDEIVCLTVTYDPSTTTTAIEEVWSVSPNDPSNDLRRPAIMVHDINSNGRAEVIVDARVYDARTGTYILDLSAACSDGERGLAYIDGGTRIWSHVTVYDALTDVQTTAEGGFTGNEVFIGHCVVS